LEYGDTDARQKQSDYWLRSSQSVKIVLPIRECSGDHLPSNCHPERSGRPRRGRPRSRRTLGSLGVSRSDSGNSGRTAGNIVRMPLRVHLEQAGTGSFDFVAASRSETATPLRMTGLGGVVAMSIPRMGRTLLSDKCVRSTHKVPPFVNREGVGRLSGENSKGGQPAKWQSPDASVAYRCKMPAP
jgi:hypothetical protein